MSQEYSDNPQHDALYHIPIETLGLSEKAIKGAKRLGVISVGDCVDFFVRIKGGAGPGTLPHDHEFLEAMFTEVEPKLQAHGYWPPDDSDDAE